QSFLDFALVLSGVIVIAVLRSRVVQKALAHIDALRHLLALDAVRRCSRLAGSFTIFLAIAQSLQLIRQRLQIRSDPFFLLVDILSAAACVALCARILSKLFGLICDFLLLLAQFLGVLLSFRQSLFHRAVLALAQQPLRLLQLLLRLLSGLLLLRSVSALRLLLHILRSLVQRFRCIGHLAIIVLARKLVELARQTFRLLLQFLRGHLIAAAATAAALLLLTSLTFLEFLLALGQFFQLAHGFIDFL